MFKNIFIMQTDINIRLNVPPTFQVDMLTHQLTDFGNWLIHSMSQPKAVSKSYRHQSLRGIAKGIETTSEELINEYLKEKYNV